MPTSDNHPSARRFEHQTRRLQPDERIPARPSLLDQIGAFCMRAPVASEPDEQPDEEPCEDHML